MAKYYLIFARMLFNIRFEVEYLDLKSSLFLLHLLFDIGLLFAFMTNLEAGPRFAEICCIVMKLTCGSLLEGFCPLSRESNLLLTVALASE